MMRCRLSVEHLVLKWYQVSRRATSTGGKHPQPSAKMHEAEQGKGTEHAAKAFGVNPEIHQTSSPRLEGQHRNTS